CTTRSLGKMLPLIPASLHCLFLLITACCQTSQDPNFAPTIQNAVNSTLREETFQSEMQRQRRNVLTFDPVPLEYTVDIEVSLTDSSFLEPVKQYLKNFRLPFSTNISNVEMTVSNISVTTVCLPSGTNSSCCSCENGYAWPSAVCGGLITCHSVSLAPDLPCGYTREMPFYGPYCEPQTEDSCGMGEPIVMNMSVKLDTDFQDDLRDASSKSYEKYKADLEKAFNASYRCLPGFVSATVTGFNPGSVFVNYEVKAGAASFDQIANSNKYVPQYLDEPYQLNQATFTAEITNRTNFTVSPVDIFEGDTVSLICDINSTSQSVTWYHFNNTISNSSRYSLEKAFFTGTSRSILNIINVTRDDSGPYRCTFTTSSQILTLKYKATKTITVSPLYVTPNFNYTDVLCNSPEMQTNSTLLTCCIDRHLPLFRADWKVNGAINITGVSSFSGNCTKYKLNVDESLCPPEKSGAVTTYTCELQTGHGARSSEDIRVTYLRTAHVTIPSRVNSTISEGNEFNITCESDVNNYDDISWKIQSGNTTKTVDCGTCIKNSKFPAMSVLSVKTATQDWNGTYICTFSQKHLQSSASVTIIVIPLPLKQNILIDPIEAPIRCGVQQALECCISADTTENYTVAFVVQQNEFQVGQKKSGSLFCYMYNYTERECKNKELTVYCKFTNSIRQEVSSENISLHLIPDGKISCSDGIGIGMEGDTLIKPCRLSDNSDGFTRGTKTYKCSNKLWHFVKDDCLSVTVNNLLTSAEVTFMSFIDAG
ncbi:PREDICTED: probable G-protein coupled receptor 116, partial [Buceros rhinoceros silvestris]|uniref:probable G-protein coupled receptor 116 n=1 Tax=Buceros rhinoceros silvestris TaxID=175836 RepID=UPI0005287D09